MKSKSCFNRNLGSLLTIEIVTLCCFGGCVDSAPEKYENGRCYEATVIRGFCPGIVVVSVTNANIGIDWTWNGKTYKNALTITNFQLKDSTARTLPIYFTIDTDATRKGEKCTVAIPCLQWAYDQSAPDERICAKAVSTKSCNEP